ncbi:hypothetical protein QA584_16865 [Anaerocolumna sp. AGMB13025]|uniref:hypothetical protein n=1 Tax=Anaerocolumna sp. AGMB13025 TaxID=3039116 RepID=UPI0024203A86|nr:hypothetical protein [Anaerocolumna sp. AGMB13025]WFR55273.1 hypothetical protein QA584_16865 [Anaerocolumna sp. AGMB13025]
MENKKKVKPVKPQGIRIEVTENGVLTTNVRIPYFIAKMGLKFGQKAEHSKKKGSAEDELQRLKDVDIDGILAALENGELTLPCLLAEADESDKNQHIKITLE